LVDLLLSDNESLHNRLQSRYRILETDKLGSDETERDLDIADGSL
jgi:hypothetical protein